VEAYAGLGNDQISECMFTITAYISTHLKEVQMRSGLEKLSPQVFEVIMRDPGLDVANELEAYNILMAWFEVQCPDVVNRDYHPGTPRRDEEPRLLTFRGGMPLHC
jgi:hypothetical protein